LRARSAASGARHVVSFTAAEFYLGATRDLNDPACAPVVLTDDNALLGLTRVVLESPAQLIPILKEAVSRRSTRSTRMNATRAAGSAARDDDDDEHGGSSRGHAMFTLTVMTLAEGSSTASSGSRSSDSSGGMLATSSFSLIDLAGAERPDKTGENRVSGPEFMRELFSGSAGPGGLNLSTGAQAFMINYELFGICNAAIMATEYNKRHAASGKGFKPTACLSTDAVRVLGSAFGGGAFVSAIVTLSQAPQCGWETWFSCNYGRDLAMLRALVKPNPPTAVRALVRRLQAQVADNEAALKRPIHKDAIRRKREYIAKESRAVLALISILTK
jgi:hypothetical protein